MTDPVILLQGGMATVYLAEDLKHHRKVQHLAALTWVQGDTAAQRLWIRRLIALDSAGEGVPGARWNLLQATRDEAGIAAFFERLDSGSAQVPQAIMFFGTLDSVTIAHRDAFARRGASPVGDEAGAGPDGLRPRALPLQVGRTTRAVNGRNRRPSPSPRR